MQGSKAALRMKDSCGVFPRIRGTFLAGPYNEDHRILGSTLRSPCFGKSACILLTFKLSQTQPCRMFSRAGLGFRV